MSWLAIEFPKLVLCFLKDLQLRWRKLPAGAVDVEVEHRHRRGKGGRLPPLAVVSGPLQGLSDLVGIIPRKDTWLEVESAAGISHLLRPTFCLLWHLSPWK
jgi:hypothetical protein